MNAFRWQVVTMVDLSLSLKIFLAEAFLAISPMHASSAASSLREITSRKSKLNLLPAVAQCVPP